MPDIAPRSLPRLTSPISRGTVADTTTDVIAYDLPALTSVFAWELNPHCDQDLEQDLYGWLRETFADYPHVTGWWQHIRNSLLHLWGPLIYPGIDRTTLTAWNRHIMGLVMIDDINERRMTRDRATAQDRCAPWQELLHCLDLITDAAAPAQAITELGLSKAVQATALVILDLTHLMSSAARDLFRQAMVDMIRSFIREETGFDVPDTAAATSLEDYLAWRDQSYSIQVFMTGALDHTTTPLAPHEITDPRMEQMRLAISLHCALANDLYSFRKEAAYRHDHLRRQLNVIPVLRFGYGHTWQQAVDHTVDMIHDRQTEYLRIRDAWFAQGASPAVREYCRALESIQAGNLHFLLINPRYHGDDFTGEFTGGRVVCRPADQNLF